LQQTAQVYFNVARVGTESFFGGPLAQAAGLEIVKELLAQIGDEALEPTTDRSFVNVQNPSDLKKSLAIEKVGGEQKAVLGVKILKRSPDGQGETGKLGGNW
jgi:hypothetical protein